MFQTLDLEDLLNSPCVVFRVDEKVFSFQERVVDFSENAFPLFSWVKLVAFGQGSFLSAMSQLHQVRNCYLNQGKVVFVSVCVDENT